MNVYSPICELKYAFEKVFLICFISFYLYFGVVVVSHTRLTVPLIIDLDLINFNNKYLVCYGIKVKLKRLMLFINTYVLLHFKTKIYINKFNI